MGLVAVKMALDYRYTPAKILFSAIWRLLPDALRIKVGALITRLQLYAALPLPSSSTRVWTAERSSRQRFSEHLAPDLTLAPASYSLVITCFNEARGIEGFLDSIASQTHPAHEVVIVDGGSTDGTPQAIKHWFERRTNERGAEPFLLRVIEERGANISRGRNIGVEPVVSRVVAFTDAGCELDRHWAEQLMRPFATDVEVSMGWYRPIISAPMEQAFAHLLVPRLGDVDPATFLPSARSLAMTKEVFQRTLGYPEYLTRAGEDSLFAVYLKSVATRFAFVPDALVFWRFPKGVLAICKMIYRYSVGDGEAARAFVFYYLRLLQALLSTGVELVFAWLCITLGGWIGGTSGGFLGWIGLVVGLVAAVRYLYFLFGYRCWMGAQGAGEVFRRGLALVLFTTVQAAGFLRGASRRGEIERRRVLAAPKGLAVLFAAELPVGGDIGHETTRALLGLFDRGYFVTLIFSSLARSDSPSVSYFEHQRLEAHLRSSFDVASWREKYSVLAKGALHDVEIVDLIQDSFSKELAAKILA